METRTEGMENENQKFKEAITYFNQKLKEAGIEKVEIQPDIDGHLNFTYGLPDSDTGRWMTLFISSRASDFCKRVSDRVETLTEIVSKGLVGHILVQSEECDNGLVAFDFEGDRIVPDSKFSVSKKYTEKLENLVYAKEGIDLAFEAYRS
jgi:hypothetical protein